MNYAFVGLETRLLEHIMLCNTYNRPWPCYVVMPSILFLRQNRFHVRNVSLNYEYHMLSYVFLFLSLFYILHLYIKISWVHIAILLYPIPIYILKIFGQWNDNLVSNDLLHEHNVRYTCNGLQRRSNIGERTF